ncbi:COG5 [Candida oxycetoniae]|uniref:Conserved oligomeric Golgi complex subunit 5 n=1 Tax=Candida oxycetoniae TaxID=497107 RepID=A0AAI9X076_9ASCO|nr:COG5 [Candida oxycetoniae]KAI3407132.2 COG5 [Candida oxycetoniae]
MTVPVEANKKELEDFEAYLETDFEPNKFANSLLTVSNGYENQELDLSTSLKKLKFDLVELDKRMKSISTSNYESLIRNFTEISQYQKLVEERINPHIQQVNKPFDKIKKEVLDPYDTAVKLNSALRKMHQTLELLRSTSFFIFIFQQLEDLQVSGYDRDIVKICRLHVQLQSLYDESMNEKSEESALSVKLVKNYQATATAKRLALIQESSATISTELSRITNFHSKNTKLYNNLQALFILDQKEFFSTFEKSTVQRQATLGSSQLSKALQSPRNLISILLEVKENASNYFAKLAELLNKWTFFVDNKNLPISNVILQSFKSESLIAMYWQTLSQKLKKNIVATMARGGPIAKNLKVYSQGLQSAVEEKFANASEKDQILDALTIIDYK